MFIKRILFVLFSFLLSYGYAQDQNVHNHAIQTDTIQSKKVDMLLVPLAFYSPETNFAFGGGGQMFFKTKNSNSKILNSNIFASAIYTLNKQVIIEVTPQIYFNKENFFLDAKFRYKIYPNLFWGIGQGTPESAEENYNQTEIFMSASLLKRLPNNVNFGFSFNYANFDVTEVQEGGLLASGTIEGSDGANLLGLGLLLNLDTRDDKFAPLKGEFFQFKTNFTSKVLGSSHSFNTYHLDLRKYFSIANNHVLAIQLFTSLTFGDSPFQAKSYYGGADVARGYFKGRYIDNYLYVAQIEYRLPIRKRWELAAFLLTGNVGSDKEGQGLFSSIKPSFGFGPRFFIYEDKRTLLRLDIGINNEGNSGIYFGINEAF